MWIALAVLAALLLCLSAAIFIPKRYSSTDILLAKERVERKSSAELLKTVPGLRMKCQQQLGLSPLCIKQLMEGAPATPLADSLIRALACQRVLDGWLFYFKRYYPLSPFAIQAEDALEASVAAGD